MEKLKFILKIDKAVGRKAQKIYKGHIIWTKYRI